MSKNSTKLYKKYADVKEEVIGEIRKLVNKKRFVFEDAFEDEANNNIEAINEEGVYFNCNNPKKDGDVYPLGELGIVDALYILGILEDAQ